MTEGRKIQSYFKSYNPVNSYTFKWSIENYAKINHDTELRSPKFRPYGNSYWYATFVKKETLSSIGLWAVNLYFHSSSSEEINVKIKVKIFNTNNDLILNPKVFSIKRDSTTAGFSFIFLKSDLLQISKLPEIVLLCEMNFSGKIFTESYTRDPHLSRMEGLNTLSGSLKKIYESSLGADITLKVQGCNILVHKTILLARSDVFAKMFQNDMKENVTGIIEIDDIEPHVFKLLLEYLYTGVCPDTDFTTAQSLYYAADKYCVLELKEAVVDSLLSGMTVQNAIQLLSFANLHNDKDFQSKVIAFIKLHWP